MTKFLAFMAVCTLSSAVLAAPYPQLHPTGYDPYAVDAIQRADYGTAKARLEQRLAEDGGDIAALLNLAAIYMATNRAARASSLLERVLAAENLQLGDMDGKPVWSHDAALAGLRGRVMIGAR